MLAIHPMAGLVLASFLPPPVIPEPQGFQVTPEITDYVVVKTGDQLFTNQYFALKTPSIARVGSDFDVAFTAQFDSAQGPWAILADRNVTSTTSGAPVWIMGNGDGVIVQGFPLGSFSIDPLTIDVPPAIGPGGHVGQTATLTGTTSSIAALLLKAPGPIGPSTAVSFEGLGVLPAPHPDVYGVPAAPFSLTGAGEVGFRTTITGGTAMVFADAFQTLNVLVRTGDQADPSTDELEELASATGGEYIAKFNGAGRSTFRSTTNGLSQEGIWYDDGVRHESVAIGQAVATGYGGTATFKRFNAPAMAATGVVAFRACVTNDCSEDGIWLSSGSGLQLIAKDLGPAPDGSGSTASGELFDTFSDPSIGLSGAIAFRAILKPQGAPQGIWRWTPSGSLRRIVRTGDSLRGTTLTFASFESQVAMADSGQIAFQATMSDGMLGLFVLSDIGTILKLAKVGEAFPIGGVNKTIAQIDFNPGSAAQGNGGFVQELGVVPQIAGIAFGLTFTDSQQATILMTVE